MLSKSTTSWIAALIIALSGCIHEITSRDITQDVDDTPEFGSVPHCVFSDLAEHAEYFQNSFSSATMERMMPANELQPIVDAFVTADVLNASVPFHFPMLSEKNVFRHKKLNITLVRLELNHDELPEIERLRRLHVLSSNEISLGIKLRPITGLATFAIEVTNWFKTDANLTNLEIQMHFTIPESHVVSAMEVLFHHKGIKGYHQARRLLSEEKDAESDDNGSEDGGKQNGSGNDSEEEEEEVNEEEVYQYQPNQRDYYDELMEGYQPNQRDYYDELMKRFDVDDLISKTIQDPPNRKVSTSFANLVYSFVKHVSSTEKLGLNIEVTALLPILHRLYSISLKETKWNYESIEVDFIDDNLSEKLLSLLGTKKIQHPHHAHYIKPEITIEVNRLGSWVRREITRAFSAPKGLNNPDTFDVEGGLFHALIQERMHENIQRFFEAEFLPKIDPFLTNAGCNWKMKYTQDIFEKPMPNAPWFITDERKMRQKKKDYEAQKKRGEQKLFGKVRAPQHKPQWYINRY